MWRILRRWRTEGEKEKSEKCFEVSRSIDNNRALFMPLALTGELTSCFRAPLSSPALSNPMPSAHRVSLCPSLITRNESAQISRRPSFAVAFQFSRRIIKWQSKDDWAPSGERMRWSQAIRKCALSWRNNRKFYDCPMFDFRAENVRGSYGTSPSVIFDTFLRSRNGQQVNWQIKFLSSNARAARMIHSLTIKKRVECHSLGDVTLGTIIAGICTSVCSLLLSNSAA